MSNTTTRSHSLRLTESAVLLAFASVLSVVRLIDLPYGGSVTAASMLPVILIAYRYGTKWGLFSAVAFSLVQGLTGINSITYGATFWAVMAIIVLDYLLAFTVLGLGGIFRKPGRSQAAALVMGTLLVCVLRYIAHVISGATVWSAFNYTQLPTVVYSLIYNATYMLPETIVALVAAYYIGSVLNFSGDTITRLSPAKRRPDMAVLLRGLSKLSLAVALVYDVLAVFFHLQDADYGTFSVAHMAQAPWLTMAVVTGVGALLSAGLAVLANQVPDTDTRQLTGLFRAFRPLAAVAALAAAGGHFAYSLQKVADKAALPAPFSSPAAFADGVADLATTYGLRYGVPVLVVTASALVAAVLLLRSFIKGKTQ